jgi:hypothetical protein
MVDNLWLTNIFWVGRPWFSVEIFSLNQSRASKKWQISREFIEEKKRTLGEDVRQQWDAHNHNLRVLGSNMLKGTQIKGSKHASYWCLVFV